MPESAFEKCDFSKANPIKGLTPLIGATHPCVAESSDLIRAFLNDYVCLHRHADNPSHQARTWPLLISSAANGILKVLTHRRLLKDVWGPGYAENAHYLRIYMSQLRHKLEADPTQPRYLTTESGIGYRLRYGSAAE